MLLKQYKITCKDNFEVKIKVLKSPLDEYKDEILDCTTKSMPWAIDNVIRADGKLNEECENYYFIAEVENKAVSLMWYTEKNGIATYGLVFTKVDYRGKGIISILLNECISFMAQSKTLKAVYLAVSNDIARAIYDKVGFEIYNGDATCYVMRKITEKSISNFDKFYFERTAKFNINKVKRGDLPLLEALYNYNNGTNSKDFITNIEKTTAVECQIIDLINRQENNKGEFMCLMNDKGYIVGACTLFDISEDTKVLDFFVHENFYNQAKTLIEKTIEKDNLRNSKKIITEFHNKDKIKKEIIDTVGEFLK